MSKTQHDYHAYLRGQAERNLSCSIGYFARLRDNSTTGESDFLNSVIHELLDIQNDVKDWFE